MVALFFATSCIVGKEAKNNEFKYGLYVAHTDYGKASLWINDDNTYKYKFEGQDTTYRSNGEVMFFIDSENNINIRVLKITFGYSMLGSIEDPNSFYGSALFVYFTDKPRLAAGYEFDHDKNACFYYVEEKKKKNKRN